MASPAAPTPPLPPPPPPALPAGWRALLTRGRIAAAAAVFVLYGAGLAYGSWTRVCAGERCPSISRLVQYGPPQTAKVYAADGRLITELGLERRTVLSLSQIPVAVRDAFIATEDKRFYSHHGIDFWRILGAAKADLFSLSYGQGFSTITMQLARNVFPEQISREKTLPRKLKEARVAIEIEHNFPKDSILELYLNQIDLGSGAHGVEAAAQVYFGKSARDLNPAEAATLAALPKAPASYNPRLHPDRSVRRRNVVLDLMADQGYLTREEAERWKAYPLVLTNRRTSYGDVAPYFVEWIRQQLEARFGRQLYEGGLRIHTTLDLDMQESAERALENQLETIEAGTYSGGKFPGTTYREYLEAQRNPQDQGAVTQYLQGAFLALDAKTGAILAMVGGRDFDDSKFNRITQAVRSPGSTFKPFVYSAAVRAGHPLSEILQDTALSMMVDTVLWQPRDDDDQTLGPIPMRTALYLSRNLATIRLGLELGVPSVIGEARAYGITTPIPPYPAIFIGAASVRPIEMISAYTAFANLGTRVLPFGVDYVEDAKGNVLYRSSVQRVPVLDTAHTWLLVSMMKDVVRRGTAASAVWGSGFTVPAAGKTGTTDTYTDAWFIGYTPQIVAGVWMGYDQLQPILPHNAGGGRIAAPAWTAFMKDVYDRRPAPGDWPIPDTLQLRKIDETTGYLATPFCPVDSTREEWFFPGTEPTQLCPVHSGLGTGIVP